MPDLDVNTSDPFPVGIVEYVHAPGISYPSNTPITILRQEYIEYPFRVYRLSSHRNSKVVGAPRIPSPHKLRLLQWYSEKPIIADFISARKIRRAFHFAKVDWRKRRPIRNPADVPEGWKVVELPTGKYARMMTGVDPSTKLAKFKTTPLTVKRLRPSNRPWTRHSPHVALDANVNDLLYWTQTSEADGVMIIGISDTESLYNDNPPLGGGTSLGNIQVTGPAPDSFFEDLGLPVPFTVPIHSTVEPIDLETLYATELDDLGYLALKRHFQKLQNQKVDLATETSQAMQTVNLVIDLSKRLGKVFVSLKKLDIVTAFKTLFPTSQKELANDYLMYQFGIKPLLGDVAAAAEHLAEYVLKASPVKSNGHASKVINEYLPFESFDSHGNVRRGFTLKRVSLRVKYSTIFKISSELERQAAQLGFTNPANVLWELAPFSFVADWFLPIGDFLQGLTALNGLQVKESFKTTFIDVYEESYEQVATDETSTSTQSVVDEYPPYSLVGSPNIQSSGYLFVRGGSRARSCRTIYCKREVIPLPDVPLPRFKSPISSTHLAEALALFSQLRG